MRAPSVSLADALAAAVEALVRASKATARSATGQRGAASA